MANLNLKLGKYFIFLIAFTIVVAAASNIKESISDDGVIENQLNPIGKQIKLKENDKQQQQQNQKLNEQIQNYKSNCDINNNNNNNNNNNCVDHGQHKKNIKKPTKTINSILLPAEKEATTKTRYLPIEKSYDIHRSDVAKTTTTTIITTPTHLSGNYNNKKYIEVNDKSYDDANHDIPLHNMNDYEHNDDDDDDDDGNSSLLSRSKRQVLSALETNFLIAPHTLWCGRGNAAKGKYSSLGGASNADKCCRKHDHCKYFIPGLESRYELFNYRPYTLSHCMCDRRFRTCLKLAQDEDSTTIGKLFFNMIQTECFVLKKEEICAQKDEAGKCVLRKPRIVAEIQKNLGW